MFVQTNHIDKVVELTILFCKYDIVISDTLGCALFVAPCDITRASWETKKKWLSHRKMYIEEFVWGTSIFWLHPLLSISFFVAFLVYFLPLPKWYTFQMAPIKLQSVAMVGTLCVCDNIVRYLFTNIRNAFEK